MGDEKFQHFRIENILKKLKASSWTRHSAVLWLVIFVSFFCLTFFIFLCLFKFFKISIPSVLFSLNLSRRLNVMKIFYSFFSFILIQRTVATTESFRFGKQIFTASPKLKIIINRIKVWKCAQNEFSFNSLRKQIKEKRANVRTR